MFFIVTRAEISVAESHCIMFYIHLPINVTRATNARALGAQGTTANTKGTIPQPHIRAEDKTPENHQA